MRVNLTVNGAPQSVDLPPATTLLDALREYFGLKGTKEYCHSGICGACTVLLDGRAASACSILVGQVEGREVLTIEGLTPEDGLHPIQQAFVENFGLQCGYCTPGMELLTKALLDENPNPTREEIVRYMGGNICRCTGYAGILRSVQALVGAGALADAEAEGGEG